MIGRRFVLKLSAAAAIAAAVVLAVVAAAYALFALLSESLGHAASAAIVAGVFALLAGLGGFLMFGRATEPADEPAGLTGRIADLVRERPLMATAAGIAAGWIFMRNPALATVVAAALSEKGPERRRRR